jgi:hypothetical protein
MKFERKELPDGICSKISFIDNVKFELQKKYIQRKNGKNTNEKNCILRRLLSARAILYHIYTASSLSAPNYLPALMRITSPSLLSAFLPLLQLSAV